MMDVAYYTCAHEGKAANKFILFWMNLSHQ